MAKSKFFCVAVEGATATDGRTIERNWIQEMAAGYNRATYGARVNLEHIRGFSPEAPFNAYGDVLALEAREIELSVNGKTEKRLALFAQIDPTDALVKLTKARQKIYTSIEVAPNFASTGKAGLVGLAATDSPASLGTDVLSFSTTADNAAAAAIKAGLDSRKQDKANLFSAAHETTIELEPDVVAPGSLVADFKGFLTELFKGEAKTETPPATPPAAAAGALTPEAFTSAMEQLGAKLAAPIEKVSADFATLRSDHDALVAKLAAQDANPQQRPPATGANTAWENEDF